jgi:hypothetical protein
MVGDEFVTAEFDAAEEVLQRLPFTTPAEQLAQGDEICLWDALAEAEVEIEPPAAEDVGEEVLHVQPGFINPALFQVGGAGLEDFEEGLHGENDECGMTSGDWKH